MCPPSLHTCTQLTLALERRLSPLLTHVPYALHYTLERTATRSLWSGEEPELTVCVFQRVQVTFSYRPGAAWTTAPTRDGIQYGRQCPSCNRVGGADGVLTPTRNRLSDPVSRPDAAEGGTRVRLT